MNCEHCGNTVPKNLELCPGCGRMTQTQAATAPIRKLRDARKTTVTKIHIGQWDKAFGGGVPIGSTTLIGGIPGAGKSRLMIQLAMAFLPQCELSQRPIFYLAAEEEEDAIQLRVETMGVDDSLLDWMYVVPSREGFHPSFMMMLESMRPVFVIVDSLQAMIGENDEECVRALKYFKTLSVQHMAPWLIVSKVNKQDDFEGRKALEHEPDITMMLYKEEDETRVLRAEKNRFGPDGKPSEISLRMTKEGLEPYNPSEESDGESEEDDDD